MICKMYSLCASGQTAAVVDRLELLPSPQVQQCVAAPVSQEEVNLKEKYILSLNGKSWFAVKNI